MTMTWTATFEAGLKGLCTMVLALFATGITAFSAHSQSACALSSNICRELIRAPRMYEALYDGSSTLYGFTQNRLKRRIERWAPAMAAAVQNCRGDGASTRRTIRQLTTGQGNFAVFASADAEPGDICYIQKVQN